MLLQLGIDVKYHHHEVGERGQQEIEMMFDCLAQECRPGNSDQIRSVQPRAQTRSARDVHAQAHVSPGRQRLARPPVSTKRGRNVFYEKGQYANMSETGLFYIGGLLRHARALCALTNPSTNSYKRLVPGFEAPVAITYGMANRSSAVRIPSYVADPEKVRLEYRPPDATANPYFALSAMLMAGIDGIVNRIDPRQEGFGPFDTNIFSDAMKEKVRFLPRSLDDALEALEQDHEFLLRGEVFPKDLLQRWIQLKRDEIMEIATMPNPFEYKLYFDI